MAGRIKTVFKFKPFSHKQLKVLTWWNERSPVHNCNGVICDGAIRSGKTVCMSLSFAIWAMESFNGCNFALCGKTIGSLRRNVIGLLKTMLESRGYSVTDHRADNLLTVARNGRENYFYLFGGKDESSQDLIQGITLAGVLLDEVALMPESFVNQAAARCSVTGSKFWFNCNPEGPSHWFKLNWIDKSDSKNMLYLHFDMDDNLSLSEEVKQRYKTQWTGVFYQRYILGLWAAAEGLIYPMYSDTLCSPPDVRAEKYVLSIDYGTQNAFAALLWGKYGDVWYAVDGYYYSGREKGILKTDEEYGNDLDGFVKNFVFLPEKIKTIIDPSAASFIALLRKKKYYKVISADNAVLDGIRETASAMHLGRIKISPDIKEWKKEAEGYVWDDKSVEDRPIKVNDHYMDATRYFVKTMHIAKHKTEYQSVLKKYI